MVLAESLGNERRKATLTTKGHRRARTSTGGDHASHVERRHGIPLDKGKYTRSRLNRLSEGDDKVPPAGGKMSFAGRWMR